MKTMKALFVISAILLVSGYTFATGKGPHDSGNVKSSVREKIASAIESADIAGKGQVTLKFGITENNELQILNIQSSNARLTNQVKEALTSNDIKFTNGSKGTYQIKVFVNELNEKLTFDMVRDQVYNAVNTIETKDAETVKVKLRVINPSTVQVLKSESRNAELAAKVKKDIETGYFVIPQKLCGEYSINVAFK